MRLETKPGRHIRAQRQERARVRVEGISVRGNPYGTASVPGSPHFANFLVFTSRQWFEAATGAHFMNLPLASRQLFASASPDVRTASERASSAAVVSVWRIMVPPDDRSSVSPSEADRKAAGKPEGSHSARKCPIQLWRWRASFFLAPGPAFSNKAAI